MAGECEEGSDNEETESVRVENVPLYTSFFWPVQMARLHPFVVVENETNAKNRFTIIGLIVNAKSED
jgi:hypothetical protein